MVFFNCITYSLKCRTDLPHSSKLIMGLTKLKSPGFLALSMQLGVKTTMANSPVRGMN